MLAFLFFAATVILFLIISLIYLYPGSKKITTVPGPEPCDPLEGNFPEIAACGSLHEFLMEIHSTYGPIASFWYGPKLAISISSPELFREHSAPFDRPPVLFQLFEPLITSDSIQFCNGSEGRARHTLYGKSFSHETVGRYVPLMHQLSLELVLKWKTLSSEEHIPLMEYMFSFAIKALAKSAFGNYMDDRTVLKVHQAYVMAWSEMESRLKRNVNDVDTDREILFEKSKAVLFDIVKATLKARRDNRDDDADYRFVDSMIAEDSELSQSKLIADAVTVFVAGFHTTGLLLTWCIYYLASNPEVQRKVQDEIESVLGNDDDAAELSYDGLARLEYMRQVLDETLRASVLAPYAARYQEMDIELGGHKISAGTPVVHALGVCSQDEKVWPEPTKFDPDRFSPENRKKLPSHAFEPFGFAGKRKCLGWRLSIVESQVLLVTVLRKFDLNLVPGQIVHPNYGLVTKPKEEIWLTLSRRKRLE